MTTTVEEAKKALKTREKELTNVIELMASEERQIREAMELLKDYQSLRANGVATAAFDAPVAKYICAAADLNLNGTCYLNVGENVLMEYSYPEAISSLQQMTAEQNRKIAELAQQRSSVWANMAVLQQSCENARVN